MSSQILVFYNYFLGSTAFASVHLPNIQTSVINTHTHTHTTYTSYTMTSKTENLLAIIGLQADASH